MKRILLVEPNKKIASEVNAFLTQDQDIVIDHAISAEEGIYTADENTPDLVILELAMANQNGFAFLHEFRSYPEWVNIPVIVHTHLAPDEAARSKAWESLGAAAYLYKPQTSLKLLKSRVLEQLL